MGVLMLHVNLFLYYQLFLTTWVVYPPTTRDRSSLLTLTARTRLFPVYTLLVRLHLLVCTAPTVLVPILCLIWLSLVVLAPRLLQRRTHQETRLVTWQPMLVKPL